MNPRPFAANFAFFVLILCFALVESSSRSPNEICLSKIYGRQVEWVMNDGSLNPNIPAIKRLDLSNSPNPFANLTDFLQPTNNRPEDDKRIRVVKYVSFANSGILRIPLFTLRFVNKTKLLSGGIEYLTLMGSDFSIHPDLANEYNSRYDLDLDIKNWLQVKTPIIGENTKSKSNWGTDLKGIAFSHLKELDLRNCGIKIIENDTFSNMSELRYLYLQNNNIHHLESNVFNGLKNLIYLDISENNGDDTRYRSTVEGLDIMKGVFSPLKRLVSLDLSYTKLVSTCISVLEELGESLQRLSLCATQITSINRVLINTKLRYLDISGNIAMKDLVESSFEGIEDTLEILYARKILMSGLDSLRRLRRLTTLSLRGNNIATLDKHIIQRMENLTILDLSDNRISSWYEEILMPLRHLKLVHLQKNNINLLSPEMLTDFRQVWYLGLGQNDFVCSCYLRHFMDTARNNSGLNFARDFTMQLLHPSIMAKKINYNSLVFKGAIDYYVNLIENRNSEEIPPGKYQTVNLSALLNNHRNINKGYISNDYHAPSFNFTYVLIDYTITEYTCTDVKTNAINQFVEVEPCMPNEPKDYDKKIMGTKTYLVIGGVLAGLVFLCMFFIAFKWWYVRYFFVTMKNIALLSFFGKEEDSGDDINKIFHYDVFVSYCNGDRTWVIDELLPHIEHDKTISVCLHERDFQVGLSILENIISCVDRSRVILLVVSEEFLLSQWCQFEMHLAQHRLIETRREHLILVLLEDIPKTRRPNTLHYLMMTKTYLVWPKAGKKDDVVLFWRRLKKALVRGKMRPSIENISTA